MLAVGKGLDVLSMAGSSRPVTRHQLLDVWVSQRPTWFWFVFITRCYEYVGDRGFSPPLTAPYGYTSVVRAKEALTRLVRRFAVALYA